MGGLSIIGCVPGVEVWVGDDKIGETKVGSALRWENLEPGSYSVRARRRGYETWQRDMEVAANQQTRIVIDIKALPEPPVPKSATTPPTPPPKRGPITALTP